LILLFIVEEGFGIHRNFCAERGFAVVRRSDSIDTKFGYSDFLAGKNTAGFRVKDVYDA
jgi:hypothetical protein